MALDLIRAIRGRYNRVEKYQDEVVSTEVLKLSAETRVNKRTMLRTRFDRRKQVLSFFCHEPGMAEEELLLERTSMVVRRKDGYRVSRFATVEDAFDQVFLSSRGAVGLVPALLLGMGRYTQFGELRRVTRVGEERLRDGSTCVRIGAVHPRQGDYAVWVDGEGLIRRVEIGPDHALEYLISEARFD